MEFIHPLNKTKVSKATQSATKESALNRRLHSVHEEEVYHHQQNDDGGNSNEEIAS